MVFKVVIHVTPQPQTHIRLNSIICKDGVYRGCPSTTLARSDRRKHIFQQSKPSWCLSNFILDRPEIIRQDDVYYAGYPSTTWPTQPEASIILQRPKPPWCLSWLPMYHPSCRPGKFCTAHSLQAADRYYPCTTPATGKNHLGSFCSTPSPHGVAIQQDNAKALTSVEIDIFQTTKTHWLMPPTACACTIKVWWLTHSSTSVLYKFVFSRQLQSFPT